MKTFFLLISCLMLMLSTIMIFFRIRKTRKQSDTMDILIIVTALIALLAVVRILIL